MTDKVSKIRDTLQGARPALTGAICGNCNYALREGTALKCGNGAGPRHGATVRPSDTCAAFSPRRDLPAEQMAAQDGALTADDAARVADVLEQAFDDVPDRDDAGETAPSADVVPLSEAREKKASAKKKGRKGVAPDGTPRAPVVRQFVHALPPDCPVTPLGIRGRNSFYLDASQQIVDLSDKDHARLPLTSLFGGNVDYLSSWLPARNEYGDVTGPQFESVAASLMTAARRRGIWESRDRVRGRGVWSNDDGDGLIVHYGEHIETPRGAADPGLVGHYVYPIGATLATPPRKIGYPGERLLELLRAWNFARGDLDCLLFLGWIGCGFLGGSLAVRPMIFVTGSFGTGKSTLLDMLRGLFDRWLIWINDVTPAYVTSELGYDCLPVAADEQEADPENDRAKRMIELARLAYSGGTKGRSNSNQTATTYTLRSAMLFSAILPPPMESSDKSRFAILRLLRFPVDAAEPDMKVTELRQLGQAALGRVVADAGLFEARYRKAAKMLREAGHGGRGQRTFGTLLTAAWSLLGDAAIARLGLPLGDRLDALKPRLDVRSLAETQASEELWRVCLTTLLTAPCEAYRGGAQTTVQQVLEAMEGETAEDGTADEPELTFAEAQRTLRKTGLTLIRPAAAGAPIRLFIPYQHQQVRALFRGTQFHGTASDGGWRQALMQAPAGRWEQAQAYISKSSNPRGLAIDVDLALGGAPEPEVFAEHEQWA